MYSNIIFIYEDNEEGRPASEKIRVAFSQTQKDNIDKVIALSEDRKIEKFRSAGNIILKLLSTRPKDGVR